MYNNAVDCKTEALAKDKLIFNFVGYSLHIIFVTFSIFHNTIAFEKSVQDIFCFFLKSSGKVGFPNVTGVMEMSFS